MAADRVYSTIYIDESGDLGINRGTRWFVLSAVIVDKELEPQLRLALRQIKAKLNLHEIHLRKITDFYKRAYISREIDNEQFTYMNVIIDTTKLEQEKIGSTDTAYNYACRLLLERVTWFLRDTDRVADIVLSARGTKRDGELIDYIQNKLIPYNDNEIVGSTIEKVCAKTAATWDMLQLADICATTMFIAHEINSYGFRTPCYTKVLSSHLYRRNGKLKRYGVKYFTPEMEPEDQELHCDYACIKKERIPGATTT